jgi:chromate transporter
MRPATKLFLPFLRLGLTAFGGPAMVAYIRDLAVKKKGWLTEESFADGTALCQSIPGATAMQTAAYVGLRAGGPWGALAAFVGLGLPAFALMTALSAAYSVGCHFQSVLSLFSGLRVIVIALIANAALNFGRASIKDRRDAFIAAAVATFLLLHGSPVIAVAASAAAGAFLYRGSSFPPRQGRDTGTSLDHRIAGFALLAALIGVFGLALLFFLDYRLFGLAAVMAKVDVFAFGGGFASVPLMAHEVVATRHWLDAKTFLDGVALGQVTPGPIVITATFVGYQIAGLPGAFVGTIGVFTPSFLMVLATVPYLDRLQGSMPFRRALRGALVSFVGLLVSVAVGFSLAIPWSLPSGILVAAAFAALWLKVDILYVVLVGAGISVFVF